MKVRIALLRRRSQILTVLSQEPEAKRFLSKGCGETLQRENEREERKKGKRRRDVVVKKRKKERFGYRLPASFSFLCLPASWLASYLTS